MVRRRAALLAGGSALALFLSACHGNGSEGPPVSGGVLRVSVRDLGSLDPALTKGNGGPLAISQLFDSLTAIDPNTGSAIPAAASSWSASADGLTWTFTLAQATFHDGTPVTAAGFKAAFDRVARKSTGSDAAPQLEPIHGYNAAHVAGTSPGLDGVQVVNPSTLRIILDRPFAELPVYLAHPSLAPLSNTMITTPALLGEQPIGNGPFKMAGPRTADKVVLERFAGYAGHTAYLNRVEIDLNGDATEAWRDFLGGRTDVAEVPVDALADVGSRAGTGGFTPRWGALYFGPNLRSPKLSSPDVRKAISLAIDRTHMADVVYGGTKEAATGIIPRGVRGFADGACADCAQDTERARQLIQTAFGGKPPEMIIDHVDESTSKAVADAIVADLQNVGLKVALRAHKQADYLHVLESGQYEIAELGWIADVPSPDGFLAQQLLSGSVNNHSGFADASFDSDITQARAAQDQAARLDLYRKAETRAFEVMPLIPIVFFRNHIGVADRVHGLRIDGAGLFDAARVWVDRA